MSGDSMAATASGGVCLLSSLKCNASMSIAESARLRKRRAVRKFSTTKCRMPRTTSRLYSGNTRSCGVSPNVTGIR